MTANNVLHHIDEETHFNCFGIDNTVRFNRLQPIIYESYPDMARKIGSSFLGGYEIESLIDQNQFGFTYLVKKINLDEKKFIIKEFFPTKYVKRGDGDVMLIRSSLNVNELKHFNYLKRFFTEEMNHLRQISNNPHQHIVNIVKTIENVSNTMYIVYTYEEGMILEEYLKDKQGNLTQSEIYNIINPVLEAVEHLHTLKICHFDIKPENILIKKDGSLVLLGFEASSLFYDEYDMSYCNGYTPKYAAPEQISVEKTSSLNDATDIYAIGVLLYRMITGAFPPKASQRIEKIRIKKEKDPYIPLIKGKGILEKYDPFFLSATDKALKFSNKDRFKNIAGLKQALNLQNNNKNKKKNYLYLSVLILSLIAVAGWNIFNSETKLPTKKTKKDLLNIEKQVVKTDKFSMNNQNIIDNKDKEKNVSKNEKYASVKQESKEQSPQNAQAVIVQNKTMKETNKTIVKPVLEKQINVEAEPTFSKNESKNPVEDQNKVDVTLVVRLRNNIGTNKILVNNKVLQAENFSAYKGETYHIDISNPYYYPLHEERTFEELKEYPEQIFVPTLGKAKVYLKGLPANTQVTVHYQMNERNAMRNADNVSIHNNTYEVSVPAGKRFSLRFSNKAYKPFATDIFILKHGEALTQTYRLQKKDLAKTAKKEQAIVPTVKKKRLKTQRKKRIKKAEKTKSVFIHKKSRKKVEKKKEKKGIKPRKEKFKKENNKPSVTEKKKKADMKKKTSLKRNTDFVWYCSAVAIGKEKISIKHADKAIARRTVMQRCTKKFGANAGCRVLGCFLIR